MGRVAGLRSAALIALTAAFILLFAAPSADSERNQRGHLIVAVGGGVDPLRLPRDHPAPVAFEVEGGIATDDGSPLPRLKEVRLEIAGQGVLDTHGLPVCPRARLRNTDSHQALERCRSALVGRGTISARVFLAHRKPFTIRSALLAFNGRTHHGATAVWVHAFSANPPLSIVLPFIVHPHRGDRLGTSLTATVPPALGNLPHLSRFQLTFGRRFGHRGRRHSYLAASCPAAAGFTAGLLDLKASYVFADGRDLKVTAIRSCRVR